MNSTQLLKILSSDKFASLLNPSVKAINHFLEQRTMRPSMTIVNYDPSDQPGSHWVAVYVPKHGQVEFFDSYGVAPLTDDLLQKLMYSKEMMYSSVPLQGVSAVCGQYCLIYLLMRAREYSLNDILQLFMMAESKEERDCIVNTFVNNTYDHFLSAPLELYDSSFFSVVK